MGAIKIILIAVFIIAIGIASYFVYSALQTPKILSVNIVDLSYNTEQLGITNKCDLCFRGYYYDSKNQKVCPSVQINGKDFNDCLPHDEVLCIGNNIKSSFNLQVKNYKGAVYCKVTSNVGDLTNPLLSYNGLNNIQDEYGEQLKQRYTVRVCCSVEQSLSNPICSKERNLDARCLAA